MNKMMKIHSLFETRRGNRVCLRVYRDKAEAEEMIEKRKALQNGVEHDIITYTIPEGLWLN